MDIKLDDFEDSILPGYLFKELSNNQKFVILYNQNRKIPSGISNKPLKIDNKIMLETKCGHSFETIDTILDELKRKTITQYFSEIKIFDDSQVFYGKTGFIVDKLEYGEKQHLKELPYLEDENFVNDIKKIFWIRNVIPDLFKANHKSSTASWAQVVKNNSDQELEVDPNFDIEPKDVKENPKIVKDRILNDDQQVKVVKWNPETIFHLTNPCEEAFLAVIRKDVEVFKQYITFHVSNITDRIKREFAKYDFPYLLSMYCILPEDLIFKAMRSKLENLLYIEIPKEVSLKLVKENPKAVMYIRDADEEVKIEAIKKEPRLIKDFENFTVDMLLAASGEKPYLFKHCKDSRPDIAEKLLAIRGDFIQYFTDEHQTEQLCLISVQSDPSALKYIAKDKKTEKVCQLAVQVDPHAIEHIDNPSEAVCIIVVSKLPGLIKDIKNQTPGICHAAVNKAPFAILFVNDQTEELCYKAIRNDPDSIKYIKSPTRKMVLTSIQQNPFLMGDLDEKILDIDICLSCAFLNPDSIDNIKNQEMQFNCMIEFTQFITAVAT